MTWLQTVAFTVAVWAFVGAIPLVDRLAVRFLDGWRVVRAAERITKAAVKGREPQP